MTNQEILIENCQKSEQGADLLIQDLRGLLSHSDPILAMVILPEIAKAAEIKNRMKALVSALQSNEGETN